jgi:hypothetical protein
MKSSFSTAHDIFKPLQNCSIFKCISWLNGSFFGWWTSGFSERGSQDLSNGANVVSQLANFFSVCTSIVYGFLETSLLGNWTMFNRPFSKAWSHMRRWYFNVAFKNKKRLADTYSALKNCYRKIRSWLVCSILSTIVLSLPRIRAFQDSQGCQDVLVRWSTIILT